MMCDFNRNNYSLCSCVLLPERIYRVLTVERVKMQMGSKNEIYWDFAICLWLRNEKLIHNLKFD